MVRAGGHVAEWEREGTLPAAAAPWNPLRRKSDRPREGDLRERNRGTDPEHRSGNDDRGDAAPGGGDCEEGSAGETWCAFHPPLYAPGVSGAGGSRRGPTVEGGEATVAHVFHQCVQHRADLRYEGAADLL